MRVIRFTAAWCSPCKRLGPVMDASAFRKGVPVEVLDIDEFPEVARHYDVQAVPTVVLLHDGEVIYQGSGAPALKGLQTALDSL